MAHDNRNLLETLKFELNFLNKGGYNPSPRTPWKPQLIFQDSPTCLNYDSKNNPQPCSECLLMQFVPPESRDDKVPCQAHRPERGRPKHRLLLPIRDPI